MSRLVLALFASVSLTFASYPYYGGSTLQSYNDDAPNWVINNSGNAAEAPVTGLTVTSANGASYITPHLAPDGTSQYEAEMTTKIAGSGGTYVIYLEATSNALLGATSTGTFYAFAVQNPTVANSGCTANAVLYKVVNGSVSQLSTIQVPCGDGTVYHAAMGNDGALHFRVNSLEYLNYTDPSPLSGYPGVGGYSMPTGNGISLIRFGRCDRIAPGAVTANSVQNYALSTEVDLQTGGAVDDTDGIGVGYYNWYRDNTLIASTSTPDWSDVGATPGSTHTYGVQAADYHGNLSTITTFSIVVPTAMTVDARQVGVRPTGSYWGSKGEQIDTRSGNLNYTYPLLQAQGRGWTVPVALSYNAQNWRLDGAGNVWRLGGDIGFGFGWRMQVGSLTPFYDSSFAVQFYQYSDSTGATYRLDQNTNGVWTSRESVYVNYNANTQRLYFNNGIFWVMGCISAGTESDAGTMYPTLIQDTNGNRVTLQYLPGAGVTWYNSSARLQQIYDVRPGINPPGSPTLQFSYNNDYPTPHLTGIGNYISSKDSFGINYNSGVSLNPPFGSAAAGAFGNVSTLSSIHDYPTNLDTSFTYDANNSGELTKVTMPFGGYLRWEYGNAAYTDTTIREVQARYLYWDANIGERTYTLTRTNGSSAVTPASRKIVDTHANAFKQWQFIQTAGGTLGLVNTFTEGTNSTGTALSATTYIWAQNAASNNYIGRLQSISDPGQSYAVTRQTDQTVDNYGNVTQTKLYDYTDLSNAAKIYNTTYLTNANSTDYASLFIRDRISSVTLTDKNNVTLTLKQNSYDQYPNGIAATNNIQMQDTADYGPGYFARGNRTNETDTVTSWHHNFDQAGDAVWSGQDVNPNHYVSRAVSSQTNYTRPDQITTSNSLTTQMGWNGQLNLATQTGANSENSQYQYDSAERPSQVTNPYGAATNYSYSTSAPQVVATTNSRTSSSYLDGFGRPLKVQRADSSAVKSIVESVYDTCGCNPLGKLYSQSLPHAPGATPVWTTYTYDSLGRLLTRTKPDGQSVTTYAYSGNTVTVTDPSGKWKKITRDVFGQIVKVEEPSPNPASEPNHVTLYTYDVYGHLTKVQMDRTIGGTVRTQLRTWTYNLQTLQLVSKTSPEAGTVSYTYNNDNTLATVTDAKNQRKVFTYDTYGRITQIARGTVSGGTFTEDTTQRTTYAYEGTNGGFSNATNGRVSQITYGGPHGLSFIEMYSYQNAGGVTRKRLQISGTPFGTSTANLDAGYSYDNEGRVLSTSYPASQFNSDGTTSGGANYQYSYDTLGRLSAMSDSATNTSWVSSVTYGPSDEMLAMTANGFSETRSYNANLQLTELVSGANVHLKYNYAASQNNGQILSQQDLVSGETITYQYDTLKRLVQASAAGDPSGSWSQNFGYDGYGNLTTKTGTNAPQLSVAVDWSTNRLQSFASYDNNGNMTGYANDVYSYDLQNRMIQATVSGVGTVRYGYDSTNHRVYKGAYNASTTTYSAEEIYFYGAEGHKYGTWQINPASGVLLQASVTKQWFGPRLVSPEDRLGSKGKYFAFGEERTNISPANPANDQEKFATYTRDSATGLDYANQRYYSSIIGRFTKPDPFGGSANVSNPQSWNQYSYVNDDPINSIDQAGTESCSPGVDFCTTVYGYSDPGSSSSPSRSPAQEIYVYPDPAPVDPFAGSSDSEYKLYLRRAVNEGMLSDCQALVSFASRAFEKGGLAGLNTSLGVFVPADNANVAMAGLPAQSNNSDDFLLDSQGANVSGFLPQYQNSDENGIAGPHLDQVHHFATFFQLGYKYSFLSAPVASFIDDPKINPGDVLLGENAAYLGGLASNPMGMITDVIGSISSLCDPGWEPR